MDIRPSDFVLEIGSGPHPKTRADIVCAQFIDDTTQRGDDSLTDRSIVAADAQYLPFADASFDYVICSHVLEHAEDPGRLISELMRVASRGYIETPSEIAERLYGWPYHNWMINLIDGRLIIQKKVPKDSVGQLFHALAAHDKNFARFHLTHHRLFLVRYEWSGKIDYQILPPDTSPLDFGLPQTIEGMLNQVRWAPLWEKWLPKMKHALLKRLAFKAESVFAKPRRRPRTTLQEIVVCPVCKGPVIWQADVIRCGGCNVTYPIIRSIPRLLPPHVNQKFADEQMEEWDASNVCEWTESLK